jgi:hypothetical protein
MANSVSRPSSEQGSRKAPKQRSDDFGSIGVKSEEKTALSRKPVVRTTAGEEFVRTYDMVTRPLPLISYLPQAKPSAAVLPNSTVPDFIQFFKVPSTGSCSFERASRRITQTGTAAGSSFHDLGGGSLSPPSATSKVSISCMVAAMPRSVINPRAGRRTAELLSRFVPQPHRRLALLVEVHLQVGKLLDNGFDAVRETRTGHVILYHFHLAPLTFEGLPAMRGCAWLQHR